MTKSTARPRDLLALLSFIGLCAAVSALGGAVTATSVGDWYQALNKPSANPPDWLFAPVWTVLYIFIAVAGWRLWRKRYAPHRTYALVAYFLQLAFNLVWSVLFFGAKLIGLALVEIFILDLLITACVLLLWRVDRPAAILFLPYGLWVTFATYLNAAIWWLN